MKILLPIDGSDYTKRMLSYIAAHDELLGSGHEYNPVHRGGAGVGGCGAASRSRHSGFVLQQSGQ